MCYHVREEVFAVSDKKNVSIIMESETKDKLKEIATKDKRTLSALINLILENYLENTSKK